MRGINPLHVKKKSQPFFDHKNEKIVTLPWLHTAPTQKSLAIWEWASYGEADGLAAGHAMLSV